MIDGISKKNVQFITNWLREYPYRFSRLMDTFALVKYLQDKFEYPLLSFNNIERWMNDIGLDLEDTFTYICRNNDGGFNASFIFSNKEDKTQLKGVFLTYHHDIDDEYRVITGSDQKAYFDRIGPEVCFVKPSILFGFDNKITNIQLTYRFMERRVSFDLLTQLFEAEFKEEIRIDIEIHTEGKMIGYRLFKGKMISSENSVMFSDTDFSSNESIKRISLPYLKEFHAHSTQLIEKILKD